MRRYHFDLDYEERLVLADGTTVQLRTIRPSDRELLRRGFDALSPRSRYLRFFSAKERLSEAELTALTSVDGVNQVALGAARVEADGTLSPAGVARFGRVPDEPTVAEAAVAVADAFQSRGLGTVLLQRLSAAARERGIERFRCELYAENERIRRLIDTMAPGARLELDGELLRADFPVPAVSPEAPPGHIDRSALITRILSHSAAGSLEVRLRHLLLKLKP